jgi:hypothetical protein
MYHTCRFRWQCVLIQQKSSKKHGGTLLSETSNYASEMMEGLFSTCDFTFCNPQNVCKFRLNSQKTTNSLFSHIDQLHLLMTVTVIELKSQLSYATN